MPYGNPSGKEMEERTIEAKGKTYEQAQRYKKKLGQMQVTLLLVEMYGQSIRYFQGRALR